MTNKITIRDARFVPKGFSNGSEGEKSGTCSGQISVHLTYQAKMVLKSDVKRSRIYPFGANRIHFGDKLTCLRGELGKKYRGYKVTFACNQNLEGSR